MSGLTEKEFIEQAYIIAFGENNKDHSFEEVLEQLRNYQDLALERDHE